MKGLLQRVPSSLSRSGKPPVQKENDRGGKKSEIFFSTAKIGFLTQIRPFRGHRTRIQFMFSGWSAISVLGMIDN
jgi:hypothetical protein